MKFLSIACLLTSTLIAALHPPKLKEGDLIAFVFPAFFLENPASDILKQKALWLEERGFQVIYYPETFHLDGYFSGTDEDRAQALMSAWKNDAVKAIWCFRGGYGSQRLLNLLDYDWIRNHPKIFIGMSDITALHSAIGQKTGLVTYLAPVFNYFNESKSTFDASYAFSSLLESIMDQNGEEITLPLASELQTLRPGKAEGELVGGNLTLIASLCGTPWQMDTKGKILVLEEVGERLYRVDRLLWQLKEAGMFDHLAGLILGDFTDIQPHTKNTFTLDEVFDHYFGNCPFPVLKNFPTGHGDFQTTLPLHSEIEIDGDLQTVRAIVKRQL